MGTAILVLGSAQDEHAWHVFDELRRRGQDVELIDSLAFPSELGLSFDPATYEWTIRLPGGRRLAGSDIRSVYWRNYNGVGFSALPDEEQAYIAHNDARSLFESFLIRLPVRWVNGWEGFQLHQMKPAALSRVCEMGVRVPPTLVTNDAEAVREFAQKHPRAIFKPVQGGDQARRLLPENLTPQNLDSLRYAPVTLQAEVPGTNVRVFVAGQNVLTCEIRTDQLDYRQDRNPQLLPHALPPSVADQSRRIADELKLLWTGIDYRLTPEGDYLFLEANPSPMFLGFEQATGLPLTKALLELLLAATLQASGAERGASVHY